MASAAAVGPNAGLSPDHNDLEQDEGRTEEVTSAIGSKEDGAIEDADDVEENEEDDIRGTARRKGPVEAAAVGDQEEQHDEDEVEGGDDLFGEGDDDEAPAEEDKTAQRQLDDEELDSGDDMERRDRVEDAEPSQDQAMESQERTMMSIELPRHPAPEPSDGEMYLMKVPDFMGIDPHAYSHTTFTPPTTDHHSNKPPSAAFSVYNTAISTIRWRHSPSDPKQLQSNARVLRWSDGSMTLQLASQPTVQYEMDGKPLAPPQRNPIKPTPVSTTSSGGRGGRPGDGTVPGERYDQNKDAFTYLVTPTESNPPMLRVTNKITAGLSVKQSEDVTDDAIEKLQAALANAANAKKVQGTTDLQVIDEDPEAKRREAEEAMRKQTAAMKRHQAAIERDQERREKVTGRSSGRAGGGGLNASMLEDEELGGGRPRKAGNTPRKPRQRRNSIYSEDEDFGRRRFGTKEDEYDEEDDFLAGSDEEEEVADDDDPDDGIVEEPRRERTPKRDRPEPAADDDADAEGEDDDDAPQARTKRRRIVDEDEDEE
ncbi:hypothetical protein KC330_g681 [Hortaea werneckii]|nr:hypothetical protein KC330_g681 [Hortaea werneckii]